MEICHICLTILVILLSVNQSFCQTGRFVPLPEGKECPATSKEWRRLALARNCPDNAPYHCIKNQYQEFGEVCVRQSWVYSGQCPVYDTSHRQIDLKPCQPFDGYSCPTSEFLSNNVYINEICLRTPKPTTTTPLPPVAAKATTTGSSPVAVAVVLILVVISVVVLVLFFYLRRGYNLRITLPFTKRTIIMFHKTPEESNDDPEYQNQMAVHQISTEKKVIERSNPCFVETQVYRDTISLLEEHDVVLVVGEIGIGKSTTCVGVLEYYRDVLEWKTQHLPTDTVEKIEEKTIVLVDITFGDIPLYSRYDPNIEKMLNRLYTSTRGCREFKVLLTSSFPLSPENNIRILKGCVEFNIQYEIQDLKKLYERYKRSFNTENDTSSRQNLSDLFGSRQSETGDLNIRNIMQVVAESAEENSQKEEIISKDRKNQKEKNVNRKSVPGKQEIDANETSTMTPIENSTGMYRVFGLPAVCYLYRDFEEDLEICNTINVLSYLDSYISSLAESNNEREKQRYSTLVYMMLNGSTISAGSIVKQLLVEIDPSLDPERLLVCATEMVDEGMLQKRGKEHVFSNAAQIPKRLSTCPTKSLKDGTMKVTDSVFSFSNDILLFVVIKSYATRNIQMFIRYSYLPFIIQFLQPKEQPDCLSIQPRVDADFLLEFGIGCAKRNIQKENELKELKVLEEFKKRLNVHEVATSMHWNIDKEKMDEMKRNIFVRKMINHHPYLKEYYAYAEPETFLSIPKHGFKSDVKSHPSCCQSRTPYDF